MDPTVPKGAAYLLDRLGEIETKKGPDAYKVIFGNNEKHLSKPITSMTIDEVIKAQVDFTRDYGSSASGRYQFMRATLIGLKKELKLLGTQVFNPNLQDRLGYHLLRRRGYDDYVFGRMSRTEFGKRLAQEWASWPVLDATRGAHRNLRRGDTYYLGDGVNKVLIKPATVEDILDKVRELHAEAPAAVRVKPEPVKTVAAVAAVAGGAAATVAVEPAGTVKTITDTVEGVKPVVEALSGFSALPPTALLVGLVVLVVAGVGYLIYTKVKG